MTSRLSPKARHTVALWLAAGLAVGTTACSKNNSGSGGQASSASTASTSSGISVLPLPNTGSTTTIVPSPSPAASGPVSLPPVNPPATTAPAPIGAVAAAQLSVDTDRDGAITPADDAGRDTWTSARGAIFTYNNDDDDKKHALDSADTVMNGPNDSRNMALIVARQFSGTPTAASLAVMPANAPVRIFAHDANGNFVQFMAPGAGMAAINPAALTQGDVPFFMEGTGPRSTSWDGTVTVTLTINQAAPIAPSTDTVALRCAPIIYPDNTRPAVRVYCMRIDDPSGAPNPGLWNPLKAGLATQSVALYEVDQNTYGFDRWVQDNMQIGYQGYPSPAGYCWVDEFNQLERGAGAGGGVPGGDLWSLIPDELLAPNGGMLYAGASQSQDSPNYGGNFEVMPPYGDPAFPFGRVMHGGGKQGTLDGGAIERHMNPEEVALIEAQGMQNPSIEISSEWLDVGHLDEFQMAVQDLSASPTHPFKLLWSSPTLAIQALKQLQNAGQGSQAVFAGTPIATTVDAILSDANLMTFNDEAQSRLDADKAQLEQLTGLTDADFIEMPVYYEQVPSGGYNFAVSQDPGVQNCIPVNDTLYMPDPVGPTDSTGNDVWKTQILAATTPLGLKVVFVDVFTSYHMLEGEAHCGSNVLYKPYDAPWWTK